MWGADASIYIAPRWDGVLTDYYTLGTAPLFLVAGVVGGHPPWLARLLRTSGVVFTLHHARSYHQRYNDLLRRPLCKWNFRYTPNTT